MADDKKDPFAALRAAGLKKQADEAAAKAARADATRSALDALRAAPPPPAEDGAQDTLDALRAAAPQGAAAQGGAAEDPLAGLDDLLGNGQADPVTETGPEAAPAAQTPPPAAKMPTETPTTPPAAPQEPFGRLDAPRPDRDTLHRPRFRIAVLGDFTGRAAAGRIEVGEALARRRAIRLDVDTFDDVIAGFATTLRLPVATQDGGTSVIEVPLRDIDDLHPDALYENLPLFAELAGLRGQLKAPATSARAVERLRAWGVSDGAGLKTRHRSAGSDMPADRRLSDFQALIGGAPTPAAPPAAAPVEALIAGIIGPHVVAAPAPEAGPLIAAVDDALSSAMRLVLHHPEFRALEAQWRSLDFLARRIETGDAIEITLYDISAEELAADLASQEDLAQSGLYRLLAGAALPEDQGGGGAGGFSALFGLYTFEETPPHAELLARLARIAAHVDAPFFAALSPGCLDTPLRDRHPLTDRAWRALRALPEAGYVGLCLPRFMLRHPYGQRTDPVDAFGFEEFTPQAGLKSMLWANPVVAVATLLAATRAKVKNTARMELGSVMSLGEMPFHHVTDRHGDQVALPCTDRNLTLDSLEGAVARGLMALVSPRGRDAVRLAGFQSLAGAPVLGPWAGTVPGAGAAPATPARATPAAPMELEMEIPAQDTAQDAAADDLDDLLADLEGADADAGSDAGLDDLDALLAGFEDTPTDGAAPGDMDDELAALLEGL